MEGRGADVNSGWGVEVGAASASGSGMNADTNSGSGVGEQAWIRPTREPTCVGNVGDRVWECNLGVNK